jgi:hypothetical protein
MRHAAPRMRALRRLHIEGAPLDAASRHYRSQPLHIGFAPPTCTVRVQDPFAIRFARHKEIRR